MTIPNVGEAWKKRRKSYVDNLYCCALDTVNWFHRLLGCAYGCRGAESSLVDTEFSANFKQATQQAQEEGDEIAATVDPNLVWRQTLSEPYKNRVYGAGGFFASSLRTSGYGDSSASATGTHTGPVAPEIDGVWSLKKTLAKRDARAEEHLRRMEEMQQQMAAFYNPLHPGTSGTVGGSGSSSTLPFPPRPPPYQPDHSPADDDDNYEDA
ncbi:hypothetical protein PIB30_053533 [Stylosanthes scabra]|uniref:Uncharacterized protein n=1 Tax=Stylosanthes scabra TaxID=79078 RepID=A0ABU6WKI6_9FABA|nr:hypothetical protein [Stylosanthes scabra]